MLNFCTFEDNRIHYPHLDPRVPDSQVIPRITTQVAHIIGITENDLLQRHTISRVQHEERGVIYEVTRN